MAVAESLGAGNAVGENFLQFSPEVQEFLWNKPVSFSRKESNTSEVGRREQNKVVQM